MQSISAPNVITGVVILILITLAFAIVVFGLFSLVYKAGTIFCKWLSQRAFYIRLRQRCQEWWSRHRVSAAWWWESTAIVFIDPVFYGYALVTLVQRLQAIQAYAQTYPQYSFWQLLDLDSRTHMQYYIALAIIFILWMTWKVQRHSQEVSFERSVKVKLDKLLNSNETLYEGIRQLTKSIDKLIEEIRKNKEDEHGKPPTDM